MAENSLELGPHQSCPALGETAPAAQRRYQPRRGLRIEPVDRQDHVGQEAVTATRSVVEGTLIGGEGTDQGAQAVWIGEGEVRMLRQRLDGPGSIVAGRERLN